MGLLKLTSNNSRAMIEAMIEAMLKKPKSMLLLCREIIVIKERCKRTAAQPGDIDCKRDFSLKISTVSSRVLIK